MTVLLALAAVAMAGEPSSSWAERLGFWSWGEFHQLDARLGEVEAQLQQLAEPALVNSSIRVGLKTGYTTEEDVRWLELELPEAEMADGVALLPPLAKGASAIVAGYGFPVRFKLELFDERDRAHLLRDHTQADFPNPGCYPVTARFEPRLVKRVRLTATEPWTTDGPEVLALAEMVLFSGNRNLALDARVNSSSSRNAPRAWTRANLTDMTTPLGLPTAPETGGSPGFHGAVAAMEDTEKWIMLELPEAVPLDEVRLVPVRRPEVPLWFDYGFPLRYRVECATQADFSDAVELIAVNDRSTVPQGMNVVCVSGRQLRARFVRLTATQLWYRRSDYVFALAEFQVYHRGQNMAAKGRFTASDELPAQEAAAEGWSLEALADGRTGNGRLLELPEWLAQLELHQTLGAERDALSRRRAALLQRTEARLIQGGSFFAAGISGLSLGLYWRLRQQRRRDAERLRQKLARDLHDEIGSNLGSITLICSMAAQPDATLESLRTDLADIERVAMESADSMRDMVRLIQAQPENGPEDWLTVLEGLSERLLRGHELDLALPTAPLPLEPDVESIREIYLFCKEVLYNIARHARASRVSFHLSPTPKGLSFTIKDDGAGFDPGKTAAGHGLDNLRARAAALKASLDLRSQPGLGTTIHLAVPAGKHWQARSVSLSTHSA